MAEEKSIYLDSNIFRRLIRELNYWNEFESFFDKEEPGLLDSIVIFTWAQLLEMVDLGRIMTNIKKTITWKKSIDGKNLLDRFAPHQALDQQFQSAIDAISSLQLLERDALLKRVDMAISHCCAEAQPLIDSTFIRYHSFISTENYMEHLSREIAWSFIASQTFVMSINQWEKRKACYDSLIALWHKLHLEGHDLPLFRLNEMHYYSYLKYSPNIEAEKNLKLYPGAKNRTDLVNMIFKFPPLRAEGDLCDGELIDFCRLGSCINKGDCKTPVVGITMDKPAIIDQRAGIFLRSLEDLKRCVNEWSVISCPGRIFSLNVANDVSIESAVRHTL